MTIVIDFLEHWYAALEAPNGIGLSTSAVPLLKSRLYKARAAANDPRLAPLTLISSPHKPNTDVWIVPSEKIPNLAKPGFGQHHPAPV